MVVPNCLFFTMFIKLHIPEHSLGDPSVPVYQVCVALHPPIVHSGDGQHHGDWLVTALSIERNMTRETRGEVLVRGSTIWFI